jgi:hypothetical protein
LVLMTIDSYCYCYYYHCYHYCYHRRYSMKKAESETTRRWAALEDLPHRVQGRGAVAQKMFRTCTARTESSSLADIGSYEPVGRLDLLQARTSPSNCLQNEK